MTDRKKPGVAFWATVGLVVVLLYVASFGPAWWLYARIGRPARMKMPLFNVYAPLWWVAGQCQVLDPLVKYRRWCMRITAEPQAD